MAEEFPGKCKLKLGDGNNTCARESIRFHTIHFGLRVPPAGRAVTVDS